MIDMNLDEVLKSLVKVEETFVRKLDFMFTGFFYEITEKAVMNTPFGDSNSYSKLYEARSYTLLQKVLHVTLGVSLLLLVLVMFVTLTSCLPHQALLI